MKLIAFSGRKQSGKTTSGEYLLGLTLNKSVKLYAFADRLKKDICIDILGLSENQCYGSDDQKNTTTNINWNGKKLTAREVMEIVGTDIFRALKVDVWTSSTINLINREKPDIAIITDVRFPDEVDAIKNIGGKVVRLTRNPFNADNFIENSLDPDKYDWSNFDHVIDNSNLTKEQKDNILYNIFADLF
jgi:hypothetical protein